MESSNGFIKTTSIPEPALVWRYVNELSTGRVVESGWSLSPEEDLPFTSRSLPGNDGAGGSSSGEFWILVVEDNRGDVDLIRHSLKEHAPQCRLIVVNDGEKALKFLDELDGGRGPCPSLVVLDLNLPKISGRQVLRRIRQSSRCGNMPVVVFSSSEAEKDKQEAATLGADHYITKPSNLDEFLNIGIVLKPFMRFH